MDKKIHLIWKNPQGIPNIYEREYITDYLFSKIKYELHDDESPNSLIHDRSVIIYSENSTDVSLEFKRHLREFQRKKYRFVLFHLSNESLGHSYRYARHALHIFRNYYDEKLTSRNITTVPLGFQSGFLNHYDDILDFSQRVYAFSFIGQFSKTQDRMELADYLNHRSNCFIHATNSWNCPTSLGVPECRAIYKLTRFVPCPRGWTHPDSFRIMESLECGAIPILKRYGDFNYFDKVWGTSPVPRVDSWSELDSYYSLNENEYHRLHAEVMSWYHGFRRDYPRYIGATLCSIFDPEPRRFPPLEYLARWFYKKTPDFACQERHPTPYAKKR